MKNLFLSLLICLFAFPTFAAPLGAVLPTSPIPSALTPQIGQLKTENRPIRIITADGTKTEFTYDHEGTRVKKSVIASGATQSTIFIGTIYEESADETIKYVHAGGQRVALIRHPLSGGSDTTFYFLADHLGSTHRLADNTGAIVRTTKYVPYGNTFETSGTRDADHKFTGQRLDDSTNLYHMGARYYDPSTGRFLTPDPALLAGPIKFLINPKNLNPYAYSWNNPLRFIDPLGLSPQDYDRDLARDAYNQARNEPGLQDVTVFQAFEVYSYYQGLRGLLAIGFNLLRKSGAPQLGNAGKILLGAEKEAVEGVAEQAAKHETEVVQRVMSRAELAATESSGLLRGGRGGTHYVSDAINTSGKRAQQRLALPQTPEVRVTLEVPSGRFSPPSRVQPNFNMPGGGMERTASGDVPIRILRIDEYWEP